LKPQDFLIGVRDFFAIIVPGATFLLLLRDRTASDLGLGTAGPQLLGFAIAAYLAGSLFSAIGSGLDLIVDPVIENERFRAIRSRKLRERRELADELRKELIKEYPCPVAAEAHPESVKSFWLSHLRLNCPAAMVELDQIEARQKLFRSLVAVFAVLGLLWVPGLGATLHSSLASGGALTPRDCALFACISAAFYVGGRLFYVNSVYRLGAAYCLPEPATKKVPQPPEA